MMPTPPRHRARFRFGTVLLSMHVLFVHERWLLGMLRASSSTMAGTLVLRHVSCCLSLLTRCIHLSSGWVFYGGGSHDGACQVLDLCLLPHNARRWVRRDSLSAGSAWRCGGGSRGLPACPRSEQCTSALVTSRNHVACCVQRTSTRSPSTTVLTRIVGLRATRRTLAWTRAACTSPVTALVGTWR